MSKWSCLGVLLVGAMTALPTGQADTRTTSRSGQPSRTAAEAPAAGDRQPPEGGAARPHDRRAGPVRVVGHGLVDDQGPFLGLGVSYFTALWRCRNDRPRLERDLEFLSQRGFNYLRVLSMVGWYPAWKGLEIAPVSYTNRQGERVEAWPDYWQQLAELIDLAYDRYGLRTQITIFADAQLMPEKQARIEHLQRLVDQILPGRQHKILMLEVANEAWQNGFPGEQGMADLREFARFLADRTEIPVAITSNHQDSFTSLYTGSAADLATWHFSRDRRADDGWRPVLDCWDFAETPGCPPVVSNEPIGPGSSVDAESEPIRLAAAAAFAYVARLPAYVFHSEAGVFGRTAFEETPGIDQMQQVVELLPADLPNWDRHDGRSPESPWTVFAAGQANRYVTEIPSSADGCVRLVGSKKGNRFVSLAIGVRPEGLELEARQSVQFRVVHPLTGATLVEGHRVKGQRLNLPQGPGAWILLGSVDSR